jgi:cell pole-organizing protein PopZ
MPENKPDQEPSIEEILASIRQIISDDDAPPPAAQAVAAPEPKPAPAPEPEPVEEDDDVLELTEVVGKEEPPEPEEEYVPPPPRVQIDLREAEEEPPPMRKKTPEPDDDLGGEVFTDHAAHAALEGFAKIASHMAIDRKGTGTVTLEDIVRELMRPMLREWLDIHLPPLIEKVVQKELGRIARRAMDE